MIQKLFTSFQAHRDKNAFCIAESFYTYGQFLEAITRHRNALKGIESRLVGVVANDDLDTYAALLAIWFEGKAFLPINPAFPYNYNQKVVNDSGIESYFDSSDSLEFDQAKMLEKGNLDEGELTPTSVSKDEMAYLLFTSGSTGAPKGVPITYQMFELFIDSNEPAGISLTAEDRCLQMFDLTFDLSLVSLMLPLFSGACVYTIPKGEIKYAYIYNLLSEERLTFAMMVPSVLSFLNQIAEPEDCESLRYSLFCGEALELETAAEWSEIAQNAEIVNVYGPTEATVYCTEHKLERTGAISAKNGVVSIGRVMIDTDLILLDESGNEVLEGEIGEICLGGPKITRGYWGNRHPELFFKKNDKPFYKTGDLAVWESDGLLYFIGRKDAQVQVQGYRVELLDVEHRIKKLLNGPKVMAFAFQLPVGGTSLGVVIESESYDTKDLILAMQEELPAHMMPTKIEFLAQFPLNVNGKRDKKQILGELGLG